MRDATLLPSPSWCLPCSARWEPCQALQLHGTHPDSREPLRGGYHQRWSRRFQRTHKHRQPIPAQGRILPTPSAHAPACWGKSCCCSRQIIAPCLASPCTLPCKHTHRAFQHSRCRGSKARPTERLSFCKGETKGVCPCGKRLAGCLGSASGPLGSWLASEWTFAVELEKAWTNQAPWESNGSWDSLGSTLQCAHREDSCPSSPQ